MNLRERVINLDSNRDLREAIIAPRHTMKLTASDSLEIYCALDDGELQAKIGIDGELLAAGSVKLSPAELDSIRQDLTAKIDRLGQGFYDEYPGESKRPLTTTGRWIAHLRKILAKLAVL